MKIVVDIENTTTKLNDKYSDYSPYNPNNKLVSIGWTWLEDVSFCNHYFFVSHQELADDYKQKAIFIHSLNEFKVALAEAEVIIAHNAKYDIQWLEEAGFDLSHLKVEDTMIREYVMARGRGDISMRLADSCIRYGVAEKGELFDKYPDLQISHMPIAEVEEYGRADIQACAELYLAQEERLNQPSYTGLRKTINMMNEFCKVLTEIERSGVKIDETTLNKVETEFMQESEQLKHDLYILVKEAMGDTKVNLDSPQQLSEVIYSRKIKEGKTEDWIKKFNIGRDARNKLLKRPKMSYNDYCGQVKSMTDVVLKTEVSQCQNCKGIGKIQKISVKGIPYKNMSYCKFCKGSGAIYTDINEIAGFKMKPRSIAYTTVGGFSTGQTFLDELIEQAEEDNKPKAKEFLEKIQRLSSISSYLSNFVGGIKTFKQSNNILHTNFNQCITATGRLSSTKPNLQNMPREATFPIRKCFVSRFDGGKIVECDFAQLEFRAAVHLARDENGKRDILNKVDVHEQTRRIIKENGVTITRQEAKSRTFKPLFAGFTGSEAERGYYKSFLSRLYPQIGQWHKRLEEEAIAKKIITNETGRQYIFPDVERNYFGGATRKTQIVNYPVQGFATGDLLQISLLRLHKEFKKLNLTSIIILTVHDSIVVDAHLEEVETVINLMQQVGKFAEEELINWYEIEPFVPFDVEVKFGPNAMELQKAA